MTTASTKLSHVLRPRRTEPSKRERLRRAQQTSIAHRARKSAAVSLPAISLLKERPQ
jgi:hypothetical protein